MQQAEPKKDKTELSPYLEKTLDDVSSGKEQMNSYENFDGYIKHVKKVLED